MAKQSKMDNDNSKMSKSAGIKRAHAKAQKSVYKNDDWDLVDGLEKDAKLLDKIETKTLPDSLQNKTKEQIAFIVQQKATERTALQNEMQTINTKREAFLVEEKKRRAGSSNEPTLETEVEKIIKSQT